MQQSKTGIACKMWQEAPTTGKMGWTRCAYQAVTFGHFSEAQSTRLS